MKQTKRITVMAMLLALGLVLPYAFHGIPKGGMLFSPLHMPALIGGLVLGPVEGAIVGVLCPILNSMITGMPQGNTLIAMCFELPVYAIVTGIMMRVLKEKKDGVKIYAALMIAMIVGRIAGGMIQSMILGLRNYSLQMWATAYFVSTFPGIVMHLLVIPPVCMALKKAGIAC